MKVNNKILVTAGGCVVPGAFSLESVKEIVFKKHSGENFPCPHSVENLENEAKQRIPAGIRRRMSRLSIMAGLSVEETIRMAKIEISGKEYETGIVFGTGYGELDTTAKLFLQGLEEGMSPTLFHNSVHNAPVGYVCMMSGIRGPYIVVSDGHISGESAIIRSLHLLEDNSCRFVLAGGGDERYEFPLFVDPAQENIPGEGSAFLLLEREEDAVKRGACCLCEIKGWNFSSFPENPQNFMKRVDYLKKFLEDVAQTINGEKLAIFSSTVEGTTEEKVLLSAIENTFDGDVPIWHSSHIFGSWPSSGALRGVVAMLCLQNKNLPAGVKITDKKSEKIDNILILGMDKSGDVGGIIFSSVE